MPVPTVAENKNPQHPSLLKRDVDLYKVIKSRPTQHSKWTKDTIIKFANNYLIRGNVNAAAKEVGMSVSICRTWVAKDWWPILLEEIKYIKQIALDGQYGNILEKSLAAILDRLENGDEVVVGKELMRRKISGRDLALISAIMFDKRQLLRGEATNIQQHNFNVDDRLADLTEAFETIAQKAKMKVIEGEVEEDVETIGEVVNLPMQKEELRNGSN